MAGRLEGKVAAITGASSGFGAAARLFVAEGCKVVLGDIQAEQGAAIAAELGDAAVFTICNVTKEDDIANLVDLAVSEFGKLNIMYNNASIIGAVGPINTTPPDEWKATLDILLNGVFYGMKHAARVMKPQGFGSIVSMSSTAGIMGGLGPHTYTAAKHAVVGLTKGVGAELCRYGIRVNCISPAGMATAMVADAITGDHSAIEEATKKLVEASPLINRAGTAEDVARAALWLASDAGITTGSTNNETAFEHYQPMIREAGKKGV